jgi:hypothetical protein
MSVQERENELGETDSDLIALEAFVVGNPELEQLETLLSKYNLFEAIGAVRMEVRHSDFLAFLIDPSQNHGLGDLFLKRLLQRILGEANRAPAGIRPVELDVMDLSDTAVRREWESIDILCLNEREKLAVLIENKIESPEHGDQLHNYLDKVERNYPHLRAIPLFLTPGGIDPSDPRYIAISYSSICDTLNNLLINRRSVMGADVFTTITHYIEMLRRHIVSDSDIAELARKIYNKHRHALDLIFEHRPDQQSELAEKLQEMIRKVEPQLELDHCSKAYIRFCPREWDAIPDLKKGEGWTPSKRLLLFEFRNYDSLKLHLLIGPTDPADTGVRQRLFQACQANPAVFRGASKTLYGKWSTIWLHGFLSRKDLESVDQDVQNQKVQHEWQRFLASDLPVLIQEVKRQFGVNG